MESSFIKIKLPGKESSTNARIDLMMKQKYTTWMLRLIMGVQTKG